MAEAQPVNLPQTIQRCWSPGIGLVGGGLPRGGEVGQGASWCVVKGQEPEDRQDGGASRRWLGNNGVLEQMDNDPGAWHDGHGMA